MKESERRKETMRFIATYCTREGLKLERTKIICNKKSPRKNVGMPETNGVF